VRQCHAPNQITRDGTIIIVVALRPEGLNLGLRDELGCPFGFILEGTGNISTLWCLMNGQDIQSGWHTNPTQEFLRHASECEKMAKSTRDADRQGDVEPDGRALAAVCAEI